MNNLFPLLILVILANGLGFSQVLVPSQENLTPEQIAAFNRSTDKVSPLQVAIKQTRIFLDVYQQEEGKWPESWSVVENKFGSSMWESPEVHQNFTKSFVLLRGVSGHIKTREEGEYDSTMMMVMAAPIERELSQDKRELGRWAVWKTFRGQIVTRWHPEPEIRSFSAWPDVQSVIAHHIETAGKVEEVSQAPELNKASPVVQPPVAKKASEAKPAPIPGEESTSSTPWSIILVLIVAGCGLLWLLLKRRS